MSSHTYLGVVGLTLLAASGCRGELSVGHRSEEPNGATPGTSAPAPSEDDAVDPEQDLAAVLSANGNVYCVHPDEIDVALETLGAEPAFEGGYTATLENAQGELETVRFELYPTPHPYVCSNLWREQSGKASPVVDLVAFMPEAGDVLCVHPDHAQYALAELGAEPIGDDAYFLYRMTEHGPEERLFRLQYTLAPILCAGGDDDPKPLPAPNAGGAAGRSSTTVGAAPGIGSGGAPGAGSAGGTDAPQRCEDPDELWPLCGENEDWPLPKAFASGIYTVFDRATCGAKSLALSGDCEPSFEHGWSRYSKFEYEFCIAGVGYCVGVRSVISARRYYRDAECKGPVAEERHAFDPEVCTTPATNAPPGPLAGELAASNDRFRLYRNSQCAAVKAETDACVDSSDRAKGRYSKTEHFERATCRRGSGYCVETALQIGRRTYYDLRESDGACRMPVNVEAIQGTACKLR